MAGLLDIFSQPQGSGLLDFLRQNAMNQQMSGGLASDQAQYGAPAQAAPQNNNQAIPLDNAKWPWGNVGAPDPSTYAAAALPPNAQPTQGQLPQGQPAPQPPAAQPAPQQAGGFLSALQENMQNMGNGGSIIGMLTGQRPNSDAARFFASQGIDPGMARVIANDPQLSRAVLPNMLGIGGQTDDIKEYHFAKKEDPTLTFDKFMSKKRATSGEYGMNPIYTVDAGGKTEAWQLGKNGEPIKVKLPEGTSIAKGIEKIDAGTKWILRDKQTGATIGEEPKNVVGKEAEEKIGQAKGTAQAALNNGADLDAEATMKKIDQFVSSKGFNEVFGQLDQYRPSWSHSNEGADALARYKQLKGTAFLSAYAMLKGGGAITDIEGQKAGDAMARLDRAQSEDEAKTALRDFREAVDMGLTKLRRAANGGTAPAASSGAPAPAAPATGLPSGWSVKVN